MFEESLKILMRYVFFLLLTRASESAKDTLARDIYAYLILCRCLIKLRYSLRSLLIDLLISLFERENVRYLKLID